MWCIARDREQMYRAVAVLLKSMYHWREEAVKTKFLYALT